jgi:small subunit ribosomal protein S17e
MGRIKTSFVKNVANELYSKYPEKFTTNFNENKEIVKQLIGLKSKKLRNVIAGYITSLKKREKGG